MIKLLLEDYLKGFLKPFKKLFHVGRIVKPEPVKPYDLVMRVLESREWTDAEARGLVSALADRTPATDVEAYQIVNMIKSKYWSDSDAILFIGAATQKSESIAVNWYNVHALNVINAHIKKIIVGNCPN